MAKPASSQSAPPKNSGTSEAGICGRIFLAHPHSVNETYFEHMRFALAVAGQLLLAACGALIHALLPCLFKTKASQIIIKLNKKVAPRKADQKTL